MRRHRSPLPRTWPADPDYVGGSGGGSIDVADQPDDALADQFDDVLDEPIDDEPIDAELADDVADALDQWHTVVDALGTMPVFAGLPPAELAAAAQAFTLSTARPRQRLEVQDTGVRRWQMIASGHVVVRRDEVPLGLLSDGDSWSEHTLLNRQRSPISVVALTPVTLLSIDEQDFRALITTHTTFRERVIARSATSADRLALPFLRALTHMERPHRLRSRPNRSVPGNQLRSAVRQAPGRLACPPKEVSS